MVMTLEELEKRLKSVDSAHAESQLENIYNEISLDDPNFKPYITVEEYKKAREKKTLHWGVELQNSILSQYAIDLYKAKVDREGYDSQREQELYAYLYPRNWSECSKLIQLPFKEKKSTEIIAISEPSKIIYNLEGYDTDIEVGPPLIAEKGTLLRLNPQSPISYVINLPQGECNAVYISVYGGFEIYERKTRLHRPGWLSNEERALLAKGIAVVNLNLVDFLKLYSYQSLMSEDLQKEIHESINLFWETLHNHPETLSPTLSELKGKKMILSGASFGGRTAIRHAELYPYTFDKYISFDGAISGSMQSLSDRPIVGLRPTLLPHLDPSMHIESICDPILLIHNLNDNNVNPVVLFDFYRKAEEKGKSDLISLHINTFGNLYEKTSGVRNTGHFYPATGTENYILQIEVVSQFILSKEAPLREIREYRAQKYEMIALRAFFEAGPDAFFVEYLYRQYKITKSKGNNEYPSDNELRKIYAIFYVCDYYLDFINMLDKPLPEEQLIKGFVQIYPHFKQYFKSKYNLDLNEDSLVPKAMLNEYQNYLLTAENREIILSFALANNNYHDTILNKATSDHNFEKAYSKALTRLKEFDEKHKINMHKIIKHAIGEQIKKEKSYEKHIIAGNTQLLIDIIKRNYLNARAENLTSYLKHIFSRMDHVLQDKHQKTKASIDVASAFLLEDKINLEVLEYLFSNMSQNDIDDLILKQLELIYPALLHSNHADSTERSLFLINHLSSVSKKQILNVNVLQVVSDTILERLLNGLSDDNVFEIFRTTNDNETPLSIEHSLGYLEILTSRIGQDRLKELILYSLPNGLTSNILIHYLGDFSAFQYLCSLLNDSELLECVENARNGSYCSANMLSHASFTSLYKPLVLLLSHLEPKHALNLLLEKSADGISAWDFLHMNKKGLQNDENIVFEIVFSLFDKKELVTVYCKRNNPFLKIFNNPKSFTFILNLIEQKVGKEGLRTILETNIDSIVKVSISAGYQEIIDFLEHPYLAAELSSNIDKNINIYLSFAIKHKNRAALDLILKYSKQPNLQDQVTKQCARLIKNTLREKPHDSSLILDCFDKIDPTNYPALSRYLNDEPNNINYIIRTNILASNDNFSSQKIKTILSFPDQILPFIFSPETLLMAIKNPIFNDELHKLQNIDKNYEVIQKMLAPGFLNTFLMDMTQDNMLLCLKHLDEATLKFLIDLLRAQPHNIFNEYITPDALAAIQSSDILEKILEGLSPDQIYNIFKQQGDQLPPLARFHDIGYLKTVESKIGSDRFKTLFEFKMPNGSTGSILLNYTLEPDTFIFLSSHLNTSELMDHKAWITRCYEDTPDLIIKLFSNPNYKLIFSNICDYIGKESFLNIISKNLYRIIMLIFSQNDSSCFDYLTSLVGEQAISQFIDERLELLIKVSLTSKNTSSIDFIRKFSTNPNLEESIAKHFVTNIMNQMLRKSYVPGELINFNVIRPTSYTYVKHFWNKNVEKIPELLVNDSENREKILFSLIHLENLMGGILSEPDIIRNFIKHDMQQHVTLKINDYCGKNDCTQNLIHLRDLLSNTPQVNRSPEGDSQVTRKAFLIDYPQSESKRFGINSQPEIRKDKPSKKI